MSPQDWSIVIGAVALVGLVNWYFLGARGGAPVAAAAVGNTADVTIRVEGGYTSNTIEVPLGSRVRLTFDRQEDNPCSEEVVVPDFGIRRELGCPLNKLSSVFFPRPKPCNRVLNFRG